MLNLKRTTKKPIKCELGRSPQCEGKMTSYNVTSKGEKICEPCTNL